MFKQITKFFIPLLLVLLSANCLCCIITYASTDETGSARSFQNISTILNQISETCSQIENSITDTFSAKQLINLDNIPLVNNEPYIPVEQLFTGLYGKINGNYVEIKDKGIRLKLVNNCRIIFVNDIPRVTGLPVIKINGAYHIASKSLTDLLGLSTKWNKESKTLLVEGKYNIPDKANLELLFPRSTINGKIKSDTPLYQSMGGKKIKTLKAHTQVEILMDKSYKWYQVKDSEGTTGWITGGTVEIEADYKTNSDIASKEELETFVNYKKFTSSTQYLVWVDLSRQKVNIMKSNNASWSLLKSFSCASGKNVSPTVKGEFQISSNRGLWMSAPNNIKVKYYVGFYGSYYFHSTLYYSNGSICDTTLGKTLSKGCIRLAVSDAKWIYDNIPAGTKVFIN
jgi:hypothetical protein